jgi:hypothetical protein
MSGAQGVDLPRWHGALLRQLRPGEHPVRWLLLRIIGRAAAVEPVPLLVAISATSPNKIDQFILGMRLRPPKNLS